MSPSSKYMHHKIVHFPSTQVRHGPLSSLLRSPRFVTSRLYYRDRRPSVLVSGEQAPRCGPEIEHTIQTLDPRRLVSSDFIDLSGIHYAKIWDRHLLTWLPTHPSSKSSLKGKWTQPPSTNPNETPRFRIPFSSSIYDGRVEQDITRVAFPPGTHGFLYYWSPPRVPLAGAVRFRITKDSEPESFDQGLDLRVRNGTLPWQIPLLVAAAPSAQYRHLSKMLQRDGLVSPALLEQCRELTREHGVNVQSTLLYAFRQPFLVSFTQQSTQLIVLGTDALFRVLYPLPFTDFRHFQPYAGSALCCFEPSSLPEHAGTRTVVLRIVKIIEPVQLTVRGYDGYIAEPCEGELMCRGGRPWSYNVYKERCGGLGALRLFFEQSAL